MYKKEVCFGIVLVSGEKSICYKVFKTGKHTDIKTIADTSVNLQKRQKKGGQSAQRIGRIRQEKEEQYIKKVSNMVVQAYLEENNTRYGVEGVVFAGPSLLKNRVSTSPIIEQYFSGKVLKVLDTVEISDSLVWDVYDDCIEVFSTAEDKDTVAVIKEIKSLMEGCSEKLTFGEEESFFNLRNCMLEKIVISNSLDDELKQEITDLSEYGCSVHEVEIKTLNKLGVDIVGVKWY